MCDLLSGNVSSVVFLQAVRANRVEPVATGTIFSYHDTKHCTPTLIQENKPSSHLDSVFPLRLCGDS